jgi:cytochrome c biogenesis protein CcdA/thiol-disulfide isomerase/thioredoxin
VTIEETSMTLAVLAYLGGVLTIVSPCILPVLPFVFARADRPFLRSGLPMLAGMVVMFGIVASFATVAGGWVVAANEYGRYAAMVLLAVFGITLIFPSLADRVMQPLVSLGARMSASAEREGARDALLPSFLLGIATGLLWAPCAGPVLGLILTGAALNGANAGTSLLLAAYALGAATSLALALLIGGRVFAALKRSLGIGEWIRRGLGVAVLAAVVAVALGLDTGFLTNLSTASTTRLEQGLIDRLHPRAPSGGGTTQANNHAPAPARPNAATGEPNLASEGDFPSLAGAAEWLNSPPLTPQALKGKVVLIDFWTYSCINCLRAIPYVRAWAEKYKDQGLVVIGVHTPEFAFERNVANVRAAVARLKIDYPVAIDNDYAIWRAFENNYWPAHYVIDAQGQVRYHHFGEGEYDQSERVIRRLLAEAGHKGLPPGLVSVHATGAEAAPSGDADQSPETYLGHDRFEHFASPGGGVFDKSHLYTAPAVLRLNRWGLVGDWTIGGENATLNSGGGRIIYRFHARDLHLVLGPPKDGMPVHFRVTIDGQAPGADHGADIDADGNGTVDGQRLYQLVRQRDAIDNRTFEIEFLDPGVQAFAITFG